MRENIRFECADCRRVNYNSTKDKRKKPERLEFKKYCRACRKHTSHREMKK